MIVLLFWYLYITDLNILFKGIFWNWNSFWNWWHQKLPWRRFL